MERRLRYELGRQPANTKLSSNKTVRRSAIVQVDAAPFKQWYLTHYGVDICRKKKAAAAKKESAEDKRGEAAAEETKKSNHVKRKLEERQKGRELDAHIEEQFGSGSLLVCISSRPRQCGRADGYILEDKELEFYMKKLQRKKGKGAAA
ncbi:small ribosomal subunit protein eS8-like [Miscanthus floridulus]|uniref:small ribosomal subunit protein eS8-like n=1 Tax=Miscanthus floridulus TaxID=154761 RepID=UPI003459F2D1